MNVLQLDRRHIWHPYSQAQTAEPPIEIVRGRGARLIARDGTEYLDLISSWWVNVHGHAHPAIAQAIAEQARTLEQVIFTDFVHEPAARLAGELAARLPGGLSRVFFSDDGSTAVEVALKLVYQYWANRGEAGRVRLLAFDGGYHGDTFGAMAAGAHSGFFGTFQRLLHQVDFLPFPATWDGDQDPETSEARSLEALEAHLSRHSGQTAGLIIEPLLQGASGMRFCRPQFLQRLSQRLSQAGLPLIFDEVLTGFGRLGAMFACLKAGVTPDITCLSKGLTGGFLPLAVTVCTEEIYREFLGASFDRALAHGHSYTANPLGCAAALASLKLFAEEKSLERVAAMEVVHHQRLERLASHPLVCRPRASGSIAALEVAAPDPGYSSSIGGRLKRLFLERRMLIRPLGNVVYLLPPYCIALEDLHRAYDAIEEVLEGEASS
jgi:adenosylmethionine-8-amino-7-oxononanoate aminotransferase